MTVKNIASEAIDDNPDNPRKHHPQVKYRIPGTDIIVDYTTYRKIAGKCETCGAEMDSHPKCDGCGILCGPGHLEWDPSPFRGHNLCGHCAGSLKALERLIGREPTWDEFLNPPLKMFSE